MTCLGHKVNYLGNSRLAWDFIVTSLGLQTYLLPAKQSHLWQYNRQVLFPLSTVIMHHTHTHTHRHIHIMYVCIYFIT